MKKIDIKSLYIHFSKIEDFRSNRGKKHKLIDIFILAFIGILSGYTNFSDLAYYLNMETKFFTKLLDLKHGIPSHDTFSRVFRNIDIEEFMDCFTAMMHEIYKSKGTHLALDGKAIRAARDAVNNEHTPYIVSAFDVDKLICVSQIKVKNKSNEIYAIKDLLKMISIKDKVITIDAIGCQKDIAREIDSKKGVYILNAKLNQETLHNCLKDFFDERKLSNHIVIDKNHGRYEKRIHQAIMLDETERKYLDELGWTNVLTIGYIKRYRTIKNTEGSITESYYISNKELSDIELGEYVRNHWRIENSLHYILDEYFKEDRCTAKKGNAMENLALLRKLVFNLMHKAGKINSKTKSMMHIDIRYDKKEIERIIFSALGDI